MTTLYRTKIKKMMHVKAPLVDEYSGLGNMQYNINKNKDELLMINSDFEVTVITPFSECES